MSLATGRAGRWTVARLFTLVVLAGATVACGGGPLVPRDTTAKSAPQEGITIEPVTAASAAQASSLLGEAPQAATGVPPSSTPTTDNAPAATPTPAASATPGASPAPSPTPAATSTPPAGTPSAATVTLTPGTATPATARAATPAATGTVVVVQAAAAAGATGDFSSQTVTLINASRAQAGLPPLRTNAALTASATAYARLMAERNFFAHDGIDGSSPQSRFKASGYAGRFKGEALAAGQSSPQSAVNTWLSSASHRDIVLDRSAVDVGIGYFSKAGTTYTTYWVLMTGS